MPMKRNMATQSLRNNPLTMVAMADMVQKKMLKKTGTITWSRISTMMMEWLHLKSVLWIHIMAIFLTLGLLIWPERLSRKLEDKLLLNSKRRRWLQRILPQLKQLRRYWEYMMDMTHHKALPNLLNKLNQPPLRKSFLLSSTLTPNQVILLLKHQHPKQPQQPQQPLLSLKPRKPPKQSPRPLKLIPHLSPRWWSMVSKSLYPKRKQTLPIQIFWIRI